jgi:hypothetical protein
MNRTLSVLLALGTLSASLMSTSLELQAAEEDREFKIQGGSMPNGEAIPVGEPCAPYVSSLIGGGSYEVFAATGVQGPPGVVYTLKQKNGKSIALLKCGLAGAHDDTGGGGGGGCGE